MAFLRVGANTRIALDEVEITIIIIIIRDQQGKRRWIPHNLNALGIMTYSGRLPGSIAIFLVASVLVFLCYDAPHSRPKREARSAHADIWCRVVGVGEEWVRKDLRT